MHPSDDQFPPDSPDAEGMPDARLQRGPVPARLDLKKEEGLRVEWEDGTSSYYPVAYLRRMSPSADMRQLREEIASNPLVVLPAAAASRSGPVVVTDAELVGNYALRLRFSDGHGSGIYSWGYLKEIDPEGKK